MRADTVQGPLHQNTQLGSVVANFMIYGISGKPGGQTNGLRVIYIYQAISKTPTGSLHLISH